MSACWVLSTSGTWHNLRPVFKPGIVDVFSAECGRKYRYDGPMRASPPQGEEVCIVCKRKAAMRVIES